MDDALLDIGVADQADAKLRRIAFQRFQLLRALRIGDRYALAIGVATRGRGQIMIRHRQRQVGPPHVAPGKAKSLERLRARHFMDEMPVDIDEASTIRAALHDMRVPDLLIEGAGFNHSASPLDP